MEFQNVIESRRSIRSYDGTKTVTKEQMTAIIRAAILAPSWKNSQVTRYYAAITPEGIAKVRSALAPFNVKNTEGASYVVITIVANRSGYERDGSLTTEMAHNEWGVYDAGLATENMILKAEEMGLGTLVMGIRDAQKMREALEIPEDEIILSVVSVGYPAAEAQMPKRKEVEAAAKFI